MDKTGKQTIKEEMILRDYLAADRTMLAVDRTFLAYIRTALTLLVAGISFIKFFNSFFVQALGWALIPFGIITFIMGLERCTQIISLIKSSAIKRGYRIQSSTTIPQPLFSFTITIKERFTNIYKSFLPATSLTEEKG